MTPQKAMMAVTMLRGALSMLPRRTAERRPISSATPRPSIMTSTRPRGLNLTKLSTQLLRNQVSPSVEIRLCTTRVFPLGSTMVMPWSRKESTMTTIVSITKMVTG